MQTTQAPTLSSAEVCDLVGCTYRQLDYWLRQGWVPGQERAPGSGRRREFTPAQVDRVEQIASTFAEARRMIEEAGLVPPEPADRRRPSRHGRGVATIHELRASRRFEAAAD